MRLLALPVDLHPADASTPAADDRRANFLAGARPALDRAYRLAGLLLADGHEAEDAVQDAFVIAWQAFDTLREADRFGAWFDRILVNGCRDRFIPIDGGSELAGLDPFTSFIERDALLAGLGVLTADERIVVVLRFWADLPLEGIAERLRLPIGTVKSRLHRALGRLRANLSQDREEAAR